MIRFERKCISLLVFVVALFMITGLTAADDEADRIAKAKAEGRIVFYATMGIDTLQSVTATFEKKYPFLKVEVLKGSTETLFNRVVLEHQTGKIHGDLVNISAMPLLKTKTVLANYRSPQASNFPAKFKDPDGAWVGLIGSYYVIGYNSKMMSQEAAPKDWFDLAQSQWRGGLGLDPTDYQWFGAILEYLGVEKGRRFMEALARQQPGWRKGHGLLAQLVAAGEFRGGLLYAHRTQLLKDRGAPIDWVKTAKPIVVSANSIGVLERAPHPNAARLLMDFLLSTDGQKLLFQGGQIPLRPAALPANSPFREDHLDLFPVSGRVMERLDDHRREFEAIFKITQQ